MRITIQKVVVMVIPMMIKKEKTTTTTTTVPTATMTRVKERIRRMYSKMKMMKPKTDLYLDTSTTQLTYWIF